MTYAALREHLARDVRAGRVKLTERDIAKHLADRNTAGLDPVAARETAGKFIEDVKATLACSRRQL